MVLEDRESSILDSQGLDSQGCQGRSSEQADPGAAAKTPARRREREDVEGSPAMAGCKRGGTVAMCAAERGGIRLSPCVLVSIFIYCNMLNYVDRGLVNGTLPEYCVDCRTKPDELSCRKENSCDWQTNACAFNTSVVPRLGIGGSFGIKETAQGVVAGSFMGGYCVFSPIFAYLSTVYKPFTLMGLGLTAWCVACALASVAPTFGAVVFARVVSGIGEASFQCIAPCFIDDSAPPSVKGKVLAAFFMAVPIGQAIGYVYGGYMCTSLDPSQLGFAGWRAAFALEGLAMVPVAFLCFFVTNSIKTHEHSAAGAGECASRDATDAEAEIEAQEIEAQGFSVVRDAALTDDSARAHGEEGQEAEDGCAHAARLVWSIVSNRVWLCATLGYAGYTFSIGAMAVWGPAFLQRRFGVALEEADVWFGATAVVTGLLGTIGGGLLLDLTTTWLKIETMEASLLLTTALMSIAMPLCFLASAASNANWFLIYMSIGQLFAFATTSPINGVLLWCVPASARTLSMALSVLAMHLLGDVPSPVVVGAMFQHMGDKPELVMQIVSSIISVAIGFWSWGWMLARRLNADKASASDDLHVPLLDAS